MARSPEQETIRMSAPRELLSPPPSGGKIRRDHVEQCLSEGHHVLPRGADCPARRTSLHEQELLCQPLCGPGRIAGCYRAEPSVGVNPKSKSRRAFIAFWAVNGRGRGPETGPGPLPLHSRQSRRSGRTPALPCPPDWHSKTNTRRVPLQDAAGRTARVVPNRVHRKAP